MGILDGRVAICTGSGRGVGAEVVDRIQRLAFDELDAPVLRVATMDVPMPYNATLEQLVIPSAERITDEQARGVFRARPLHRQLADGLSPR